jgi:hypothetical protein
MIGLSVAFRVNPASKGQLKLSHTNWGCRMSYIDQVLEHSFERFAAHSVLRQRLSSFEPLLHAIGLVNQRTVWCNLPLRGTLYFAVERDSRGKHRRSVESGLWRGLPPLDNVTRKDGTSASLLNWRRGSLGGRGTARGSASLGENVMSSSMSPHCNLWISEPH